MTQIKPKSIAGNEEELTLVITSEAPESVVEQIAALPELGEILLIPGVTRQIHDVYYDDSEGSLGRKGWAFRIREVNLKRLVTLKGPPARTEWGGVRRVEYEAEWSREALDVVASLLATSGISLRPVDAAFDDSDPHRTVKVMGTRPIHDRETVRQVREAVSRGDEPSHPVAELVIDSVTYHFTAMDVRHYEVEIEALSPEASGTIAGLAEMLLTRFGSSLRRWRMGKTATGKRLERLLVEGTPKRLIKDGRLLPTAYDRLQSR